MRCICWHWTWVSITSCPLLLAMKYYTAAAPSRGRGRCDYNRRWIWSLARVSLVHKYLISWSLKLDLRPVHLQQKIDLEIAGERHLHKYHGYDSRNWVVCTIHDMILLHQRIDQIRLPFAGEQGSCMYCVLVAKVDGLLDTLCNNIDGPPPYSTDRVDLIYYNRNQ